MPMVRCPACLSRIVSHVAYCPKCGKPKPRYGWERPLTYLWGIALCACMLIIATNIYISVSSS